MGVFESFGLAQINDLGFDLTMLNLKSGSTCFWIVLVKKSVLILPSLEIYDGRIAKKA